MNHRIQLHGVVTEQVAVCQRLFLSLPQQYSGRRPMIDWNVLSELTFHIRYS